MMQAPDTDHMGALPVDPLSLEAEDHVNYDEPSHGPAHGPPHAGTGGSSKMRPRPYNHGQMMGTLQQGRR
jgi:hypothetical protein